MSTGVDGRHRQDTLHYLMPGSDTRRRFGFRARKSSDPSFTESEKPWETPLRSVLRTIMAQAQRSRFLKFGATAGALLLLLFWLFPSRTAFPSSIPGKLPLCLLNRELRLTQGRPIALGFTTKHEMCETS